MALSSSNYAADAYVTAANPAPGRIELTEYPVRSGTQWDYVQLTKSDGGIGLNVYVAGGAGPLGAIPVSQTNPTQISLSGVTIGGVIEVTSSQANPAWITGSVYVLNQSSGSGGISGTITASITGVVEVSQSNVQTTQSVYILQQPIGVTGNVGISGTASVYVEGFGAPIGVIGGVTVSGSVTSTITGTVAVSQTNVPTTQSVYVVNQTSGSVTVSGTASVSVTNFPQVVTVSGTGAFDVTVLNIPATQSVFVVNPASSSITGTVTVSGTGVFQVTGSVFVLNPSSASLVISGALDVTSSQANPVWVTGNFSISGSGQSTVVFVPPNASPSASVVTSVQQTSSIDLLLLASDRVGYTIFNSSTVPLSLFFGPSTGTASYVLAPRQVYESQDICFIGDIYGQWPSDGAGFAIVSEFFGSTSGSSGSFTLNVGNLPATQSVYVVNQQSASLSGVNVVSGALQITGTVSIAGFSGTISGSGGGMPPASASSHNGIAFSTSSTSLLASNSNRKGFSIYNDSNQTYLVRLGAGASTTVWSFSLFAQQYYESPYPGYTGDVTGIGFTSGSGTIHVEEMS